MHVYVWEHIVRLYSFTANVADRRLEQPPLTLFSPFAYKLYSVQSILDFDTSNLGYLLNVIERKGRKNKILENL